MNWVHSHSIKHLVQQANISSYPKNSEEDTGVKLMEGGHISIETDPDENLAAAMLSDIPPMRSSRSFIFRVPEQLRKENENKYEPSIISIGPFHHGKQNLLANEDYKKIYLNAIILRSRSMATLKDLIRAVRLFEESARGCYAEPINLTSDEFVTMMVLDGCFIIELLYRYRENNMFTSNMEEVENISLDNDEDTGMNSVYKDVDVLINSIYKDEEMGMNSAYSDDKKRIDLLDKDVNTLMISDPIFSSTWMEFSIRRDLLLIENQIPSIVLSVLLVKLEGGTHEYSLGYLLTCYFSPIIQRYTVACDYDNTGRHLLDMVRNFLLPAREDALHLGKEHSIYSVTDLTEVGVKFKRKDVSDAILDITFKREGTLEMPCVNLGEGGLVLLVNLIALEQYRRDYTDMFTSYAVLLSNLITSKNDVKLLRNEGIIVGTSEVNKRLANEVQSLCRGVEFNFAPHYNSLLNLQIDLFCQRPWNKWRAAFRRGLFTNLPVWAILPVFGVNAILILTVIQTIFSVLSYFPRISF